MIYILDVSKAPFSFSADAYECRIVSNSVKPLARPRYNKQSTQTVYSCKPVFSSAEYEVHALSVYEVINTSPPSAGNATVQIIIRTTPNRPIILVLGSYEPVNWILNVPTGIIISKVILVSMWWGLNLTNHAGEYPQAKTSRGIMQAYSLTAQTCRQIRTSSLNANEYVTRWLPIKVVRYWCCRKGLILEIKKTQTKKRFMASTFRGNILQLSCLRFTRNIAEYLVYQAVGPLERNQKIFFRVR